MLNIVLSKSVNVVLLNAPSRYDGDDAPSQPTHTAPEPVMTEPSAPTEYSHDAASTGQSNLQSQDHPVDQQQSNGDVGQNVNGGSDNHGGVPAWSHDQTHNMDGPSAHNESHSTGIKEDG